MTYGLLGWEVSSAIGFNIPLIVCCIIGRILVWRRHNPLAILLIGLALEAISYYGNYKMLNSSSLYSSEAAFSQQFNYLLLALTITIVIFTLATITQLRKYKQNRKSPSEGKELIVDSIAHQHDTQNEHIALERATVEEQSEQSKVEQPANNQRANDSISSSSSTNDNDNQENTVKIKLKKANNSLQLNSRRCTNCGAVLEEDARYCSACGQKVESRPTGPKYCRFCGSKLETEFKYCNKCGHKIGGQFDEV